MSQVNHLCTSLFCSAHPRHGISVCRSLNEAMTQTEERERENGETISTILFSKTTKAG